LPFSPPLSALGEEDCAAATIISMTCSTTNCEVVTEGTCPDNCQPCFDSLYSECGGCSDWDTTLGKTYATQINALGCSPASTTMMAAAALLASTTAAVLLA
tara:strand:- start:81 stop:383 length:303 start_codon:yes stop_codon:yes gene_type:complete